MSDIGTGRSGNVSPGSEIRASASVSRSGTPLPPAIARLPSGSVLTGTVAGREGQQHIQLDTQYGRLSLQPDQALMRFLTRGTSVMLRLETPPPPPKADGNSPRSQTPSARLLTIDGTPISKLTAPPGEEPEVIVRQSTSQNAQAGKEAGTTPRGETRPVNPILQTYAHLKNALLKGATVQQQGAGNQQPAATGAQAAAPRSALLAGTSLTLTTGSLTPRQIQALMPLVPVLQSLPTHSLQQLAQQGIQLQVRVIDSQRPSPLAASASPVGAGAAATGTPVPPAGTAGAGLATSPAGGTPSIAAQTAASAGSTTTASPAGSSTATSGISATSTPAATPGSPAPSTASGAPLTAGNATPLMPPSAAAGLFSHAGEGFVLRGVIQYLAPQTGAATPGSMPDPTAPRQILQPGQLPSGAAQMILDTPVGSFQLPKGMPAIPAGSQLTLDILNLRPLGEGSAPLTSGPYSTIPVEERPPAPLSELLLRWETLEEAAKHAQTLPQEAGARMLLDSLPQPNMRLATSTLFFLSALGMNTTRHWLGQEAISMLQATRPRLLQKLEQEFATVRQLYSDSSQQPWQVLLMPMLDEDKIHPAIFYFKKGRQTEEDAEGQGKDRFVVEVNLSQFGPMQFDGLYRARTRPPEGKPGGLTGNQLSLVIRTHAPLPDAVRQHIGSLYYGTMEGLRMEGNLAFDITPHFPDISRGTLLQKAMSDTHYDASS